MIDASARSCVYCNWWQADPPPPRPEPIAAQTAAADPQNGWRKYVPEGWNTKILGVVAFVALLILAFVIGSLIHGFEPSDVRAAQEETAKKQGFPTATQPPSTAPAPAPRSNVELVPDNGSPVGPGEAPITSAPSTNPNAVPGAMGETQRDDATALPSEQYAVAAQRARAEQQQQQTQSVDPRSITGAAYQQGQLPGEPAAPRPRRVPRAVAQITQPVAVSQPVPDLHGRGHARLALTVGTDGRVHEIDVIQPLQGDMGRLIGAVQRWRFRPATQNGIAVTSRFTVDINVE